MEYRETLFLPLMALLVMDETAPAPLSREGGAAMHCGKLDFMSVIEQNEDDGVFELMCIITDYMSPAA